MSTGQFFTVLFLCALVEAVVLAVCVPVMLWARTSLSVRRAQARRLNQSVQWTTDAEELLGDIYSSIKTGETVAPKELEDRILDAYSQGKNTYHRKELQ